MKAQRTCLMRAKNLMALNFYSFILRYIRHKSRLPSRQATTSLCDDAYKVCYTTHAWEQRVSHSSAQHAPELPHALYSANNYATTIRYSLYNAPWLPWQLSDLRAPKSRPSKSEIVSEHLRETCLHQMAQPSTKDKREKCFILYRAKTAYRWSRYLIGQNLNDSNKLQQIIDPIMVSKGPVSLTFHGHLDSLRSHRWPKMVHKTP